MQEYVRGSPGTTFTAEAAYARVLLQEHASRCVSAHDMTWYHVETAAPFSH